MHRMDLRPQDSCNNWTASALSKTWAWSNGSQQKSEPDSLQPQTSDAEQYQAVADHMQGSDNYSSVVMYSNEKQLKRTTTNKFLQSVIQYQRLIVLRVKSGTGADPENTGRKDVCI